MSSARQHIDKYLYRVATDSIMYVDEGETERERQYLSPPPKYITYCPSDSVQLTRFYFSS